MNLGISQLELNLSLHLLKDHVTDKEDQLSRLQYQLGTLSNGQPQDQYTQLINFSKQLGNQIELCHSQTSEFFTNAKMKFIHEFFHRCFILMDKMIKELGKNLQYRVNQSIENASSRGQGQGEPKMKKIKPMEVKTTEQQGTAVQKAEQMKKVTRRITKDLQNIEYYLHELTHEDSTEYEQRQRQYYKLVSQRRSLQTINPSNAHKHIKETVNHIENSIEAADKIFQEAYLTNYLDFKSYLQNLKESQIIFSVFKQDVQQTVKQKFLQAVFRAIQKYMVIVNAHKRRHQISIETQTLQKGKPKLHHHVQNMLMVEKKMNQKLTLQIQGLKRTLESDRSQVQKRLQNQQIISKQWQNKYFILELMYNQKGDAINKLETQRAQTINKMISKSIQTNQIKEVKTLSREVQTSKDFYHHFQDIQINELHDKIRALQQIVNHKEYVIKEMQAVKTFRDNFKSKKQILSVVMVSEKRIKNMEAKSLHYLQEESQNRKDDGPYLMNSVTSSTKRIVTFRQANKTQSQSFHLKKKKSQRSKKKIPTFCTLNDKIVNLDEDDEFIQSRSETQRIQQEVSLKSILKVGVSSHNKTNQAIQTDQELPGLVRNSNSLDRAMLKDEIVQKIDEDYKNHKPIIAKSRLRPSLASTVKSSRSKPSYNYIQVRKSNVVCNDADPTEILLSNNHDKSLPSITQRKSQSMSPNKKTSQDKFRNMMKQSKFAQSRVNTLGNQMLHVNNTLNFNIVENLNLSKMAPGLPIQMKQNKRGLNKVITSKTHRKK